MDEYTISLEVYLKRRTYKRIDLDCMVTMDIYIKSLERMLLNIE